MKDLSTQILFSAVGVLAASGPTHANHVVTKAATEPAVLEALNMASLASIESTYLKVPPVCKARSFNASATELNQKQARTSVLALYSTYEA